MLGIVDLAGSHEFVQLDFRGVDFELLKFLRTLVVSFSAGLQVAGLLS